MGQDVFTGTLDAWQKEAGFLVGTFSRPDLSLVAERSVLAGPVDIR